MLLTGAGAGPGAYNNVSFIDARLDIFESYYLQELVLERELGLEPIALVSIWATYML